MIQIMKEIQLTAKIKIHPGKVNEPKIIAEKAISIFTEKEKGKACLQYNWFLNSDGTECVVWETSLDSNALMIYMANVGDELEQMLSISVFSAEIYGSISDVVKNAAAPINPMVYSVYNGLS